MTSRPRTLLAATSVLALTGVLFTAPSGTAAPTVSARAGVSASSDATIVFGGKAYARTELAALIQPTTAQNWRIP